MVQGTVPIKTPEGQAELSTRQRRLSQRHRTVLFLIDGKRSANEVRALAARAGAGDSCFDELIELGMIMLPPPTFSLLIEDAPHDPGDTLHVDLPLSGPNSVSAIEDSVLPPSQSLQPDSTSADALPGETPADSWYAALEGDSQAGDASFLEARSILVRAVRTEAPVAGSLTLLRLKRARSRDELVSLLDEVEQRIVKPHRSLAAMQTLRRARVLLDVRVDSNLAPA